MAGICYDERWPMTQLTVAILSELINLELSDSGIVHMTHDVRVADARAHLTRI